MNSWTLVAGLVLTAGLVVVVVASRRRHLSRASVPDQEALARAVEAQVREALDDVGSISQAALAVPCPHGSGGTLAEAECCGPLRRRVRATDWADLHIYTPVRRTPVIGAATKGGSHALHALGAH
jgi:hypothetical protein